jgi:hypothetical protein
MDEDDLIQKELMRNRFIRMIGELTRGTIMRTTFQDWEVELLLDVGQCTLEPRERTEILRQYQKAVERQLDYGEGPPLKLSEFLQRRNTRRA